MRDIYSKYIYEWNGTMSAKVDLYGTYNVRQYKKYITSNSSEIVIFL